MPDIQFEVITDLTVLNPQHIETNFEAVDAYLTQAMEPYTSMVVTEDSIGDAKKTLATLRKLKDGINAQKIEVKREWMKPYTEYEGKAKTLMSRVDKGIINLDAQLKDYDAKRKNEKIEELRKAFLDEANALGVLDYLTWEKVFNPKWGNASVRTEAAITEIRQIVYEASRDLDTIREQQSAFETAMLDEYRNSHSLREAFEVEKRLQALQEAEQRKKAQTEAEAYRSEESAADGQETVPEPRQQQFIRRSEDEEKPSERVYTLYFRVFVTARQANALKDFFKEQGIEYQRV